MWRVLLTALALCWTMLSGQVAPPPTQAPNQFISPNSRISDTSALYKIYSCEEPQKKYDRLIVLFYSVFQPHSPAFMGLFEQVLSLFSKFYPETLHSATASGVINVVELSPLVSQWKIERIPVIAIAQTCNGAVEQHHIDRFFDAPQFFFNALVKSVLARTGMFPSVYSTDGLVLARQLGAYPPNGPGLKCVIALWVPKPSTTPSPAEDLIAFKNSMVSTAAVAGDVVTLLVSDTPQLVAELESYLVSRGVPATGFQNSYVVVLSPRADTAPGILTGPLKQLAQDAKDFVHGWRLPVLPILDSFSVGPILDSGFPVILMCVDSQAQMPLPTRTALFDMCKSYKNQVSCAILSKDVAPEVSGRVFASLLIESVPKDEVHFRLISIRDAVHGLAPGQAIHQIKKFFPPIHAARLDSVQQVTEALKLAILHRSSVKQYFKSEVVPDPEVIDSVRMHMAVADTFLRVMGSTDPIVSTAFVMVYAEWCGYSSQVAPIWWELAKRFKDLPSVRIVKIDGSNNDVPGEIVEGYPTFFLYKWTSAVTGTASRQYTREQYFGERSLNGFVEFLALHGAHLPVAKTPQNETTGDNFSSWWKADDAMSQEL